MLGDMDKGGVGINSGLIRWRVKKRVCLLAWIGEVEGCCHLIGCE